MLDRLVNLNTIPLALLILLTCLFLIQIIYYLVIFIRLARYKQPQPSADKKGISVVICAHNEYYNLKANLPLILEQDYPEFEVLVVNHVSDDETGYLLSDLQREYPKLSSIEIHEDLNFFTGKKFPLAIGIKSAKYDRVLLTDADCKPASRNWISSMQSAYHNGKEIVLGYSPYSKSKGLLNRLIRFDTAHIATQYLSYGLAGIPYMGVGRNLSYLKSLFYDSKGFIPHYRVRSGDDDLFINRAARKSNTAVMVHPDSFTISEPKKTFSHWILQKRRHFTTAGHYRFLHRFLLGLYTFDLFWYFVLSVLMLALNYSVIPVVGMFVLRMAMQYLILAPCFRKLGEKDLVLFIPLLEIVLLFLNSGVAVVNVFRKPKKWK
ncbi:MAG: glycosyltransferase [Bacteroidota bacterium]|jgi:glycosyltransferase involved in cell wall biosynthesis